MAEGMAELSKVKVCDPGGTSGSRVKTMRSFPGSVAIIGFTGEVKFMTRVGGFVLLTWAVKWTAAFPINNRREVSWKFTGEPRKRCISAGSELSGTRPR